MLSKEFIKWFSNYNKHIKYIDTQGRKTMKIKFFCDCLYSDSTIDSRKKRASKKNKEYLSIDDRVNQFTKDKKVIEIKTQHTNEVFEAAKLIITVLYED